MDDVGKKLVVFVSVVGTIEFIMWIYGLILACHNRGSNEERIRKEQVQKTVVITHNV